MYEKFRSQFIRRLLDHFDSDEINTIINELNVVASDYDIVQQQRGVIPYGDVIPEVVKTFIACKKIEGYSNGTLTNYKHLLMSFFGYVRKPLEQIETNDIRVFLYAYQEERKISNRSLDKYQTNLRAFFEWCYEEHYIENNVAKRLKPIKYERKDKVALTQLELETLRNACDDVRDRAIIEFIYSTGCRVSELCILKKDDINWNTDTVHLFGKGSKHRTSFLNAKAKFYLGQYLSSRTDDSEYVFVSKRQPHDKISKAGVEKVFRELNAKLDFNKKLTPHILRHTTATTGLNNGMPIDEIQKMLGHSSVATTMIYAKTSLENVKADHKRFII